MICKSMQDPSTTHVSTFTHTFVIFNDLWYWNSKTALPYFCAFVYFAQTPFLVPRILLCILVHFVHTSIIALTKPYNFYKGKY